MLQNDAACLCLAAVLVKNCRNVNVQYVFKGSLMLVVVIRRVKRYVFQRYGCAEPSMQQSLTIPEY